MKSLHSAPTDELEEFAASYALGSLEADERSEFGQHMAACGVCSSLTAEFGVTSDMIPETLDPLPASATLRQRVLAGATATVRQVSPQAAVDERETFAGWVRSLFKSRYPALATVFVLVVIGGLITWNLTLQFGGSDDPDPSLASAQHLYNLAGTSVSPASSGAVYRADETIGFLVLAQLPEPPAGHVYQVWRHIGSDAHPEDTFIIHGGLPTIIPVRIDVSDADTLSITIEPEGGSTQPTGDILLLRQT